MDYKKRKIVALSVVALLLAFTITVGVSFSWIDDVKQVEFQNSNLTDNNAPLKTGVDINAGIKITKNENTINLGNILENSDLVYNYSEQGESETKAHVKYDGTVAASKPVWTSPTNSTNPTDSIERKKGYFYESGDMHLSGCFSDGEAFYFPRRGASGYREGNKDDENVNYISFTTQVSSPDANVDFWFKSLPTIKKHGTNTSIANARYAISVDGEMHVYSNSGTAFTCKSDLSGTEAVTGVRSTKVYTYGDEHNTTTSRGANSNTLFSIKKGDTVNMTIKIWLEDGFDTSITATDIDFKLVSSWAYTRDITIIDQTSSCKYIASNDATANSSWLGTEKLYMVLPDVLTEMGNSLSPQRNVTSWNTIPNAPFYDLRTASSTVQIGTTAEGFTKFTVKNIPLVYKNEKMMIIRADNAWYSGNYTTSVDNYSILCYNWWSTALPNTFENASYKLYGGSHDNLASRYFSSSVDNKYETYQGYGTWGNLVKIQVDGRTKACRWSDTTVSSNNANNTDNLAYKGSNDDSIDLYICDFSDKSASGEVYIHGMSYEQSEECWFAYVPESSSLLQFYYRRDNNRENGYWAYGSWSGKNPQRRPQGSTKYYFTHRIKHNAEASGYYAAGSDGIGYWEGVDKVYLIKNGNIKNETSVKAYMYHNDGGDDYDTNANKPGVDMTDTTNTDPRDGTSKIYSVSTVKNSNSGYYPYIQFKGGNTIGRALPMCPGCYFDWNADLWLGSLTGTGRGVEEATTPPETTTAATTGGTDVGGGSFTGYTGSGNGFKIVINGQTYTAGSKTVTSGTEYKVKITSLPAGTHQMKVYKNSSQYKNGQNEQNKVYETSNNMNLNISTASNHTQDFSIKTNTSGNFIVTFHYDNWNSSNDTIIITSILKEG